MPWRLAETPVIAVTSERCAENPKRWRDSTPLCPTGHLPRKGGDRTSLPLSPISYVGGRASPTKCPADRWVTL
ncbi:MAG: hypothetical protein EOQ47_09255 [Mesorhizobium sp.]|nr:MAG: hypothetical protein EOQ47_09255 [Mesorhizobium sp.]